MEQIWNITLSIIASVGGAGAIVGAIVKFTSNIIAEKLSKKYEIDMNKTLESYKANIEKKMYISKARFDTEFKIYKELSESVLTMIEATYWLFPKVDNVFTNENDCKNIYLKRYESAGLAVNAARKSINANAAFIPVDFYDKFKEISDLCATQCNMYTWCGDLKSKNRRESQKLKENATKCYERTKVIDDKQKDLISQLRIYMENLEVWE